MAKNSPLRFSKLQPPRIPNNTFSYHLKKLINCGYVEATEKGYVATRKALKLVVFGAGRERSEPVPTAISMIYVVNNQGQVLLINRNNQPFRGWYGIPSGLLHLGETLQQAARRELFEKTTMVAAEDMEEVGVLDFRYLEQDTQDIFVHAIAFVYRYNFTGDKNDLSNTQTKYGQLSWSNLDGNNILPEVQAIKSLVDGGKFSHVSVNFVEPAQLPVFSDYLKQSPITRDLELGTQL